MKVLELLENLTSQGVELWTEGGRLRYRAPKDVLTTDLVEQLRENKQELVALLADEPVLTKSVSPDRSPDTRFPLTHGQQALWFLYQTDPKSAAYNVASTARIRSDIDPAAMRRSWERLVARHPSLRSTFTMRGGNPLHQVHDGCHVCFEVTDASSWGEDELKARVSLAYRRPFDLERGPVARLSLFTHAPQDHVLLLTIHHIACDAWSLSLLQEELRRIYPLEKSGSPRRLPPMDRTYADYVHWHHQMLAEPAGARLWDYWRSKLAGELPLLNLPTDYPRPSAQTFHGSSLFFDFPTELVPRLRQMARGEGATLYMTLLATYQVLLHRYTGQDDLLVGGPTAGRTQMEFSDVVGYFVNPVVLRADLSGNPSFRSFLRQVRRTSVEALAHQDFPFSLIVERLKPKRDPSRSPLFQVVFLYLKPGQFDEASGKMAAGQADVDWGGLVLEPFDMPQQEGQFDLTLEIIESPESIRGVFKYNTDLFGADTVARIRDHYLNLVAAAVADPGQRVSDLALLSETERDELLVKANEAHVDFPTDSCIQQLFESQVQYTPDAVAVEFDDQRLTYRQLNERANQLAHFLRRQGVKPDDLIAISMQRSLEMVVGLLGILKAGGAYLPVDPTYPAERRQFMLADSQATLLLVAETVDIAGPQPAQVVCLDDEQERIAEESGCNLDCVTTAENLAYMIYTSGSTGRPKGVGLEHRGLCHLAIALRDAFFVHIRDRVLQFASLSFDASVEEMFSALIVGATLCLARQEELLPGPGLAEQLRAKRINVATLPPSVLAATPPDDLPELDTVIAAGEASSHELVRRWGRGRRFVNGYGPTEATVCATSGLCTASAARVSIGCPLPDKQIYVLDRYLQPLPVGVVGELYIGGVGLARGYWNRPDLTAERFVPDPYSSGPGSRLYKTGDLCVWREGGTLEFLGRIDQQVKIRAFRIELGEVEAVLAAHQAVQQSVVLAREDVPGEQRLVAYVVWDGVQSVSVTELRESMKQQLPEYMLPSAFVLLDSLPLTPSGKVDRRALPAPERVRPELAKPYVAPRTSTEEALAKIWAEVLDIDKVGVHDNYFELGGASIGSLRIVTRAGEAGLSIDPELLKPELLFEHPTVAELAALVGAADEAQPIEEMNG